MDQIDQNAERLIRNDPPPLPPETEGPLSALGVDDGKMKSAADKLADIKRKEIAADESVSGNLSAFTSKMMPRLEEMSRTAGVEAEKLKPWNADAESAKRQTDPIAAFGSLGSVFGILASAFTHAPMENALNASAAAMNAIKASNAEDYKRAYTAWEANTKQALERHQIEHAAFEDALTLTKTNMQVGLDQMRINAVRFGNQKDLVLLESGMSKELFEYKSAQQKLALELGKSMPGITLANAEMSRLFALGFDTKNPQSEKSQEALKQFNKEKAEQKRAEYGVRTPEQLFMQRYIAEHKDATAEEISVAMGQFKKNEKAGSGAANLTTDRQRAQDVSEYRKKLRSEENEDGSAKWTNEQIADKAATYERHLKSEAGATTGNRRDDIVSKIDRINHIETLLRETENIMLKHKAITGVGGMLTRPAEIVSNILGSNKTDRKQFQRNVETMRLEAPRILLDTHGRPISAEADRINTMIAGLSPGDTGPNAVRAYTEFLRQLDEIKLDLNRRIGGDHASESAPSAQPPRRSSWQDWPTVQP